MMMAREVGRRFAFTEEKMPFHRFKTLHFGAHFGTGKLTLALGALGLAAALAGCGEDVEPLGDGSLAVSWRVNPLGCKAAGVERVEVKLANARNEYVEYFSCAAGKGVVSDIEPGNYDLTLLGLDKRREAIFSITPRVLTISADKLRTTDVLALSAKPARVKVFWRFDNGLMCGANGVKKVEIALYDDAYFEHHRELLDCAEGLTILDGLVAGNYLVEASARTDDGRDYTGIVPLQLGRGSEIDAQVVLTD